MIPLIILGIMALVGFVIFIFFIQQIIFLIAVLGIIFILYLIAKGQLKTPDKWTPAIVILIVVVLVFLAFGSGLLFSETGMPARPSDYNETTYKGNNHGYDGQGVFGQNKELLDSIRYISSWKPGGLSEKIVITGQIRRDQAWFWDTIDGCRYAIWLATGPSWSRKENLDFNCEGGSLWGAGMTQSWGLIMLPYVFELDETFAGYIRVEMQFHWHDHDWFMLARDDGTIMPGRGEIHFTDADKLCEVGEEITISWNVGYATTIRSSDSPEESNDAMQDRYGGTVSGGWVAQLWSSEQNDVVDEWDIADNKPGTRKYTVKAGDFKCGGDNELVVTLYNTLVKVYDDDIATIDDIGLAPNAPVISISTNSYEVGDTITISLSAEPNKDTNLSIVRYHIKIYYDQPYYLIEETYLNGTSTYTTPGLPDDGTIKIEARAYDECRPSATTTEIVKVYKEGNKPPIDLPNWDIWIWVLIIIIAVIVGYVVYKKFRR